MFVILFKLDCIILKKAKIGFYELEELAAFISDLDYENLDGDTNNQIEQAIYDKFGIDLDQFQKIVEVLMPLIDVGESPLTGTIFKGFSKKEGNHGTWLLKTEV
jgi:hypothetical protein